jgi:dihydroceramide fatty acyl 2-hydroxylase
VSVPELTDLSGVRRADTLRDSPRMFESDLLDRFSRVHPITPLLFFVPVVALLAGLGIQREGTGPAVLWMLGGLVFWTFAEYWLHRTVFHFEPDHPLGRRLHFIIHGVHHDHPNDRMRLVMPPSASLPLAIGFLLFFRLALGPAAWLPFGGGFLFGYLVYDMTHYHLHHHKPKTSFGKRLREQHMRHHFQDHDTGFGVSSPLWDHVFGTSPRRRSARAERTR